MDKELKEALEKVNEFVQKNRVWNDEFAVSYISRIYWDDEREGIFFGSEIDEDELPF